MLNRPALLRSSTAIALVAFAGAVGLGSRALADCVTVGNTTTCDTSLPNPYTDTVGNGPGDDDRTVVVENGAGIEVNNRPGISLGDNALITLEAGSRVQGNETGGGGNYGTGPNVIEFNSFGTLQVDAGATVEETGTHGSSEAVNVHGYGNLIENSGLIRGTSSAAIWFEDHDIAPDLLSRNQVDNFGTIERVGGSGSVIGSNAGAGIIFRNRTGGEVIGGISFGGGDDILEFEADSLVTGNIDGGGGSNILVLSGAAGSMDTLAGAVRNTQGLLLNFWDGDAGPKDNGNADGGDGTWQNSTGNDNWTEETGLVNAPFSDGAFAIFMGAAGTVTVDGALGNVTVSGVQYRVISYAGGFNSYANSMSVGFRIAW